MNAISKKLLSLLVVVAMVCIMVPVVSVPAAAANPGADAIAAAATIQSEVVSELDSKAAQFAAGGTVTAKCPVCGSNKVWNKATGAINSGHWYIPAGYTPAASSRMVQTNGGGNVCLYLNGQTVTGSYGIGSINGSNKVNVMGSGTIEFSATSLNLQAMNGGDINLYGGTYRSLRTDKAIIELANNGGDEVNIYAGVTIERPSNFTGSTPNVHLKRGVINMYGGKISGGNSTGSGGNVQVLKNSTTHQAIFNMYGGEITGGTATSGGNVHMNMENNATGATFNMYDGVISGGTSTGSTVSDNVFVVNATFNMYGGTIYAQNGNTSRNGTAIRLANATLSLSGDASIVRTDGGYYGNTQISGGCKLYVDNSWEGEASVNFNTSYTYGNMISNAEGECGAVGTSFAKGGSFSGKLIYHKTGTEILGKNGDLYLAGAEIVTKTGADLYATADDAVAAYQGGESYVKVYSDTSISSIDKDVYLDIAGHYVNIADTNATGKLYPMDSSNDTYETYASISLSDGVTLDVANDVTNPVAAGYRYVAVPNDAGGYSIHRIDVSLTNVTLRAGAAGLYYKAAYKCDDYLANKIGTYGVAVSVDHMPGANFLEDTKVMFSAIEGFEPDAQHTVAGTSCSVFGILKDGKTDNADRAAMPIYANPYILIDVNGTPDNVEDDVAVVGYTSENISWSLNQVVTAVKGMTNLKPEQAESFNAFLEKWSDVFNA